MFTLTETFNEDCFEYEGKVLHVDMRFDNILRLFEMFDDQMFFEHEKVLLGLMILIEEYGEVQEKSFEEQCALFKFVLREFLDIDVDAEAGEGEKVMNYVKDAELIYASFLAVYNIDLFEMQGKLHWQKFRALLSHLKDDSPLKQVIGYRKMKVPSQKEAGKEYRDHVLKMKQIYALDDERGKKNPMQTAYNAMDTLFGGGEVKRDG